MMTMRALELGDETAILDHPRVHDGAAAHQAREHTALGEMLERGSTLRVDGPEHAALVEEHVTRGIAERTGDSSRCFTNRYGRHYCSD
jgi:hypothetical protein